MMTGNDAVTDVEGRARSARKSATAYRTISEVSEELEVPQHVLRFWETKFSQVRPLKRGGGRRYYRPEDVQLLRRIQRLLYQEGYTIKGVQRLLREGGRKAGTPDGKREPVTQPTAQTTTVAPAAVESAATATTAPATPQVQQSAALGPDLRRELEALLHELKSLRAILTGEEPS